MLAPHIAKRLGRLAGIAWLVMAVGGCGAAGDVEGYADERPSEESEKADEALEQLAERDIRTARQSYREILEMEPDHPTGLAGVSVTDTLLAPGAAPIDTWIAEDLGGEPVDNPAVTDEGFDAQAILYQDGGYLYWLSRGARWESRSDSTGVQGIKDLIADRLPWSRERLDSLRTFADGLDVLADASIPDLLALADHLRGIETRIESAVTSSHAPFRGLLLPGEMFHDSALTMTLGRSELATIAAGLAFVRGSCHFLAAYRWDWTLQEAFKTHPDEMLPEREDHWTAWDVSVEFLDRRAFRTRAEQRQDQLTTAREAYQTSLNFLQDAISYGLDSSSDSALQWDQVDAEYARDLHAFFNSLRQSLSERTTLPHTEPEASANFDPLFSPGRRLPESERWLEHDLVDAPETTAGEQIVWRLRGEAIQQFFVAEVFDPPLDVTTEEGPEMTLLSGDRFGTFLDNLAGDLQSDFGEAYLTR